MLNFKTMGALAGVLKNKDRLRAVGEETKARLEAARVVGDAGSGAVRVTATGRLRVESVALDAPLAAGLAEGGAALDMAQRLIADAVNDALAQAEQVVQQETARAAEELGLGDLPIDGLTGPGGLLG